MGMPWIYQIPSPLLGGLIVATFVGGGAGGLWLSRRLVRHPTTTHNDVAGFLYAVIGVIYAVLLGMTAVAAWDDFQSLKRTTIQESNALQNLVHGLAAFPEPGRSRLRDTTAAYVRSVVTDEWPAMHRAEPSPRTQEAAEVMIRTWVQVQPQTPGQTVHLERSLHQLHGFLDQRQLRLDAAGEGLEPLMWAVLLFGAVLTIGFSFFFWTENLGLHALMTCSLAALIAIIVYWIVIFDHPLWGYVRISPEPFTRILTQLEAQGSPGLQEETGVRR